MVDGNKIFNFDSCALTKLRKAISIYVPLFVLRFAVNVFMLIIPIIS